MSAGSRSRRRAPPNFALTRAGRRLRHALRRAVAVLALLGVAIAVVVVVSDQLGTDRHGARTISFTIDSRFVDAALPAVAVIPAGTDGAGRPLLVFLHGKGEDQESSLSSAFFAALARQGSAAPDIVFPYGGSDSYWHDRAGAAWGRYVSAEVIPRALSLLHADPRRVAIGGISMGGFGALDIARLHPRRFCAAGGHSAALFPSGAASAAGAFDNAADFAHHDLVRLAWRSDPYGATPVWLDVGAQDPFRSADAAFADDLRAHGARVTFSLGAGGHDSAYWNERWGDYLRFYSQALQHCRVR
jgi:S-formylglutathione hydrolase FrmB